MKQLFAIILSLIVIMATGHYARQAYYNNQLNQFVNQSMNISKPKISPFKQQVIKDTFIRVVNNTFTTYEEKEHFALLVLIESGFNSDVSNSSASAIGLTQILPKYTKEFVQQCNFPEINVEKDAKDIEINLMIGACVFKNLIKRYNNNPALALGAYNAGTNSQQINQLLALKTPSNEETLKYLTKFFIYKSHIRN